MCFSDILFTYRKYGYVNKNNERVVPKSKNTYSYKGYYYIIPEGLEEIIYKEVKNNYQIEFLENLKESKLPEYSYLRTLEKDQLYSLAVASKSLEEDFAISDRLPEAAVKEKIKEMLLDKYENYTHGNMPLNKALTKSLEDKPIEKQITILRNKIAQIENHTPKVPTQKNVIKP